MQQFLPEYAWLFKSEKKPDLEVPYAEGSRELFVLNRHSGKVLWRRQAVWNFRHNSVVAGDGRLFCIDGMTKERREFLVRRGKLPEAPPTLWALELKTGNVIWKATDEVFGTWLSYHAQRAVVVEAGSRNRDRATDEVGRGIALYDAATGRRIWKKEQVYAGPPLLVDDRILTQGIALDWETGERWQRTDPLTGKKTDWLFHRKYGCDTAIGCQNLLTFRSAAAGFFDLAKDSGTGNFGGFRTSCTATLIPADGVIASPDYTRTCVCSYQQRSSLALVPMPDVELWTFFGPRHWDGDRIRNLGLNFGAPGDRRDGDDVLWMEFPRVGGDSPDIEIEVAGDALQFHRQHALEISGELPWVTGSNAEGVRRVTITLLKKKKETNSSTEESLVPQDRYQIELWFSELAATKPGQRQFEIRVNGEVVRAAVDIMGAAGKVRHGHRLDLGVMKLGRKLTLELNSTEASGLPPVLSGIRLRQTLIPIEKKDVNQPE